MSTLSTLTILISAISDHACSLTDMDGDYMFRLKSAFIKLTLEIINSIYTEISGTDLIMTNFSRNM